MFGLQVMAESNEPTVLFDKARNSYFGTCTDQSTEQGIVDAPNIAGGLAAIDRDLNRILRQDVAMGSAEVRDSRLLPRGVSMTDALHIVFGGFEAVLKRLDVWRVTELAVRDIANFLRDRTLRWRFRAKCLFDRDTSEMFRNWSAEQIDWEFEFLERVLDPLTEVIEPFIAAYDLNRMRLRSGEPVPGVLAGAAEDLVENK